MKPTKLNRKDIRMAATMLMLANRTTHTLAVANYLRSRGFKAGQSEVSSMLLQVASREEWIISDKGVFRSYRFPALMALPMSADCSTSRSSRSH